MSEKSTDHSSQDTISDLENLADVRSLYSILRETTEKNRSTTALIFWKRRFTYDNVLKMVDSLAESLRDRLSLPKGARVGLLLPNSPPLVIALYAISKIGAVSVPINSKSSLREIENVVRHSEMRCLITTDSNLHIVKKLVSEDLTIIVSRMQDFISLGSAMKRGLVHGFNYIDKRELSEGIIKFSDLIYTSDNGPEEDYSPSDIAMLAYSGSTSLSPKSASLTHRNLFTNMKNLAEWFPKIERRTTTLAVVPFHHMFSLLIAMLVPFFCGSTVVLIEDQNNIDNVLSSITDYLCDYFVGNPSVLRALLERKDLLKFRIGTVKVFIAGGDTITEEFAKHFEETTDSGIVTTYGTKEVTGVSHINPLDKRRRKYGSIGMLIGSTSARIVDEDTGEEAAEGTVGLLSVRGDQVMKEYWNNEEATEEVLKDGWFLTGDMARVDSDGFYFLYQRRREAIVSDGSMVYAAEVEEVIKQNQTVEEVAVIGLPDEKRGEIIKAYVIPKEGKKVTERELKELCDAQLSEYKRPSIYEFREELPKNMEGQVIKRILREESLNQKA